MLHIGIAGYKRSGKDTVAEMLIEELQSLNIAAKRRAFADSLKEECAKTMSPIVGIEYDELLRQFHGETEEKERWRMLLQWWGTEFRRYDNDNYWMDLVAEYSKQSNCAVLITPDVRFKNEIKFIKDRQGISVKVTRTGIESSDEHSSEKDIKDFDNWDYQIYNTSDLIALRGQVQQLAELLHSSLTTSVFDNDTLLQSERA